MEVVHTNGQSLPSTTWPIFDKWCIPHQRPNFVVCKHGCDCHWHLCLWSRKGVKPTAAGTKSQPPNPPTIFSIQLSNSFQYSSWLLHRPQCVGNCWIGLLVYNLILQFPSSFGWFHPPNSPCQLPAAPQAFVCGTLSSAFGPTGGEKNRDAGEQQWAMKMENRRNGLKQIF